MDAPRTLQQAIVFFSDYENCRKAVEAIRWPDGVVRCPTCGSERVTYLARVRRYKCYAKHAKPQFSLKIGTIFEDSAVGFEKWLPALWLLTNCKNGISSYELARALGVTQKTAWFMLSRLRLALQASGLGTGRGPMKGHIEADETFIGGKARNMHGDRKARVLKGRESGTIGKVAVMGLLQRHGEDGHSVVRTVVVPNQRRRQLQQHIRQHVRMDGKTVLYTDALKSYEPVTPKGWMPSDLYVHKVIDHAEKYVDGEVHTNGVENFWSLLKRSIKGTYVSIEPFHLFRYLDEQVFRFNNRKVSDAIRFAIALKGVLGKRLTYAALTGSELPQTC
jgi:transposase-like protein